MTVSELSEATALAMSILDRARDEPLGPRKEQLIELGKAMVGALTQARNTEAATAAAKQAARMAELSCLMCIQSVNDVVAQISAWHEANLSSG